MTKTTVGIVEDNPLLAQNVIDKLALSEDLKVVLQAANGKGLFVQLQHQALPDVILMDIEMAEMDGIETTREVKRLFPLAKILMLTVFDNEHKLFEAIQAGASGYLLKDEKPARLIQAISEVLEGGAPLSPQMAAKALNLLRQVPNPKPEASEEEALLTAREKEVLEYLKLGKTVRQIAEVMFVSDKTVRKHLEHIYQKLQVKSSREAMAKLMK